MNIEVEIRSFLTKECYLEFAVYELNAKTEQSNKDILKYPEYYRELQSVHNPIIYRKIVAQLLTCESRALSSKTLDDNRTSKKIVEEIIKRYNGHDSRNLDLPFIVGYKDDRDIDSNIFYKGVFAISRKRNLLEYYFS